MSELNINISLNSSETPNETIDRLTAMNKRLIEDAIATEHTLQGVIDYFYMESDYYDNEETVIEECESRICRHINTRGENSKL